MGRGAWRATVHGVAKSRTWLNDFHLFHRCSNFVNSEDGLAFDFGLRHSLKTPILLKIKNLSFIYLVTVPAWHRSQLGKYHCLALRVGLSPFPLSSLFCLQKQPSSVRMCWKSILKVLFKKLKKKFWDLSSSSLHMEMTEKEHGFEMKTYVLLMPVTQWLSAAALSCTNSLSLSVFTGKWG